MTIYAVYNMRTDETQWPFSSLDEARGRGMTHVAPGDSYVIWAMPVDLGGGQVVEESCQL